jgi:hypothetical protein
VTLGKKVSLAKLGLLRISAGNDSMALNWSKILILLFSSLISLTYQSVDYQGIKEHNKCKLANIH